MHYACLILAGLVALATGATLAPPALSTDAQPTMMASTAAAATVTNTTQDDCNDDQTSDCWSRPDSDCFGIYEPWSRVHCPVRCGFCPEKFPPCEDKLPYCTQFEDNTCTDDTYRIWARNNCRKHCNLCAMPTRPPGTSGEPPVTGNNGGGSSATPTPMIPVQSTPQMGNSGSATSSPGTVARGVQGTLLLQEPGSQTPGMCLYKGNDYKEGTRWDDGCTYECSCLDASQNLIVCTDRCTRWQLNAQVSGCKLVKEDGECCERIECGN